MKLAVKQRSRYHCQRNVAFNFKLNLPDYHVGGNVSGLSWAPSKAEDNCQTKGMAAGDSVCKGPIDSRVFKVTEVQCC